MLKEEIKGNNEGLEKLVEDKLKPVLERIELLGVKVGDIEKKALEALDKVMSLEKRLMAGEFGSSTSSGDAKSRHI